MISAAVQRDIEDIGKSINTDAIITPRVGEPFESIPMVSRTALPRITDLEQEKANKVDVETALLEKVNTDEVYLKSQSYSIDEVDQGIQAAELNLQTQIAAVGVGNKAYKTYVDMDADKANIAAKSKVTITNDTTSSNNGDWQFDGSVFTKSIYDPLAQAKVDATTKANAAEVGANNYTKELVVDLNLKKSTDTAYIPIVGDAIDNRILGFDTTTETLVGAFPENSGAGISSTKSYKYFAQKPLAADINHILSYGQSLSVGATATEILSIIQPYFNMTFNTGPRQDGDATSIIPLVEQFNNPAADGGTNRGETHCSGMANYASLMMLKAGINPQSHVIFASTGGHGGATIGSLAKGGVRYTRMMTHVTKAKELNAGKSYHLPVIPWIQGENNADTGGLQTPYADYKAALIQLQVDMDTDIRAITGQVDPVRFITYQMSYAAATWPDVAKAQLDLAREHDKFMFATACYHLPFAGDHIHLTNIGYKWMGAYFGRAYKQYMIEGRKPDFLNPLSAYIKGNQIIVKFDVPVLPLKIDTSTLANTTNAGFRVMDGVNNVAISSVSALNDTVVITLASAPSLNLQVRYALDYLGTGLSFTGGASGNLRDSTTDSVEIAGQTKPLYHVCPHFEMTAYLDKGI